MRSRCQTRPSGEGRLAEQAERNQPKPAKRRRLELDQRDESGLARNKKREQHKIQAKQQNRDLDEVLEEVNTNYKPEDERGGRPDEPDLGDFRA